MKSIEKQALSLLMLCNFIEKHVKINIKDVIPNYDDEAFMSYINSLPSLRTNTSVKESIAKHMNELYKNVSKKFPK
jgi:hypothetical protein